MKLVAGTGPRIVSGNASLESEFPFSDLQKAMLDATPDCIKVVSVDGNLLTMNRAGCLALNVPTDSEFGMPWLPLLSEDVHELGAEALREAAQGRSARFPGKSLSADEVRYWDNLLTPLVSKSGRIFSILCVSRDVTLKTQLEKQLEEAISREKLLSKEIQHRIKNLFSVVSGLVAMAEKEAAAEQDPEAATHILREKLGALARASDVAFADSNIDEEGTDDVNLEALLGSVLKPYGNQCVMIGDQTSIYRSAMTNLALFLHELATNSVKYGALSTEGGNVTIRWTASEESLDLSWIETDGPKIAEPPQRNGFGSKMVDRIVQSSGGSIDRQWRPEGLVAKLHLPNLIKQL